MGLVGAGQEQEQLGKSSQRWEEGGGKPKADRLEIKGKTAMLSYRPIGC